MPTESGQLGKFQYETEGRGTGRTVVGECGRQPPPLLVATWGLTLETGAPGAGGRNSAMEAAIWSEDSAMKKD